MALFPEHPKRYIAELSKIKYLNSFNFYHSNGTLHYLISLEVGDGSEENGV